MDELNRPTRSKQGKERRAIQKCRGLQELTSDTEPTLITVESAGGRAERIRKGFITRHGRSRNPTTSQKIDRSLGRRIFASHSDLYSPPPKAKVGSCDLKS
jgi:hypothetical protein